MKKPASITGILDTASQSGEHLAELRKDFSSRLGSFRHHRSASEQQELTEDFSRVLAAWGIADADIPGVIRLLRLRLLIFAVPLLACVLAATFRQSPAAVLALALVTPPCLLGLVTTAWRISILQNRRFLPLSRWLRHVAGFPRKRP